jgi:hypothetical protein
LSLTARFDAKPCFLSSLRISLTAARLSRRGWISRSRIFALLVDGTPQVHGPPGDPHDHLVEVPIVARPGPPLPQASRQERAEFKHPAADRFIGHVEPAFGEQFLDVAVVAVAQGEADTEPNRVLDGQEPENEFADTQLTQIVSAASVSRKSLKNGAPERSRTPNPQIRSLVLYPVELRAPAESGPAMRGGDNYSTAARKGKAHRHAPRWPPAPAETT